MAKRNVKKRSSSRPKAPPMEPETLQSWAIHYCERRGFGWDFAVLNHAELVDDAAARQQGYIAAKGIIFHSIDPMTGKILTSGQIRHSHPPVYNDKERKFSQRKGTPSEPYFAACLPWKAAFKDPKVSFVISEGPTRALAGAKQGLYVISLTGVDCHGAGDELHPSLQRIKWRGREVYICYDHDALHNERVRKAEARLARKLVALGAKVHIIPS